MKVRKNLLAFALALAILPYFACSASAQIRYEPTPAGIRRAIVEGKIKEALTSYVSQAQEAEENAMASSSPQDYREIAINAWSEASRAARLMGELQKALVYAERAFENGQKTGNPALELRALNQNIYLQRRISNSQRVDELIDLGFTFLNQLTDEGRKLYWTANLYNHLGTELIRKREYQKAIDAHSRSLKSHEMYLEKLSNQGNVEQRVLQGTRGNFIYTLYRLAEAYRLAGKLQAALEQVERAFKLTERWRVIHSFEKDLYHVLGEIYLQKKDTDKALENFHRALSIHEKQRRVFPKDSTRIGDVLLQVGKPVEAVSYYQRAIAEVESARSLLQSGQSRQSFFDGRVDPYFGIINALSATDRPEDAFNYSERVRARAFLDLLGNKLRFSRASRDVEDEKQALHDRVAQLVGGAEDDMQAERDIRDLETKYEAFVGKVREKNKEHASLLAVEPLRLREVQSLLDPKQTLVEYFVTGDQTFVWVVQKDQIHAIKIPLSQAALKSKINSLRSAIAELKPLVDYQHIAREIFDLLIAPIIPHLKSTELIIVPHGVLHYLPFQALYSPRNRYLVEDYSISYLSNASLLQFIKAKRKTGKDKILAFGNPDLGNPTKALDFAELEIKEVQKIFPNSAIFSGKEATETRSKALSPQYDILHFAAHAELDERDPLSSRILLARSGEEDGNLEVREIFEMNLNANLVVLSACDTALGKLSSGDELVGLTRAFIYAGTPSVIASLWKVDDASTARLMSSFYTNLKTKTKVESLRQAQLEMIQGETNPRLLAQRGVGGIGKLSDAHAALSLHQHDVISTSHPYFWAPFILVGDGK